MLGGEMQTRVVDTDTLKRSVSKEVERRKGELVGLSLKIHSNPELGFQEEKASAWLTEYLEKNGFRVERGICDLPTAFRATYGSGRPAIAFLAEYDALPGLGHACGHNIIAASAVGAGVAARLAVEQAGGSVAVIGTPAEELHGGKAFMVERGGFDDLDAAMLVHPGVRNSAFANSLACIGLDVEFFGRAAHAAARPDEGINALDAMLLSFNAINALRQHLKGKARIHGIITKGGEAANVIPAYSAGSFLVRAEDDVYLDEIRMKVLSCFQAASQATGARFQYKWAEVRYAALKTNTVLAKLFAENIKLLGRPVHRPSANKGLGSTDMGNVSVVVPAIHPSIAIAPQEVLAHSPQFAAAACSGGGHEGLFDAARAMAMTAVDLLTQPQALEKVVAEFRRQR